MLRESPFLAAALRDITMAPDQVVLSKLKKLVVCHNEVALSEIEKAKMQRQKKIDQKNREACERKHRDRKEEGVTIRREKEGMIIIEERKRRTLHAKDCRAISNADCGMQFKKVLKDRTMTEDQVVLNKLKKLVECHNELALSEIEKAKELRKKNMDQIIREAWERKQIDYNDDDASKIMQEKGVVITHERNGRLLNAVDCCAISKADYEAQFEKVLSDTTMVENKVVLKKLKTLVKCHNEIALGEIERAKEQRKKNMDQIIQEARETKQTDYQDEDVSKLLPKEGLVIVEETNRRLQNAVDCCAALKANYKAQFEKVLSDTATAVDQVVLNKLKKLVECHNEVALSEIERAKEQRKKKMHQIMQEACEKKQMVHEEDEASKMKQKEGVIIIEERKGRILHAMDCVAISNAHYGTHFTTGLLTRGRGLGVPQEQTGDT